VKRSEFVPRNAASSLRRAYQLMHRTAGHQGWWPGDTPFEICVGAILTQNTSWRNVERALANLKSAGALAPRPLLDMPMRRLAGLLRPAGYFNVKARRLRAFVQVLVQEHAGDLRRLFAGDTATVRKRLLVIHGIGPETADSMLLYAGGHLRFVIDAYTKRIFQRHGWWPPNRPSPVLHGKSSDDYHALQELCEKSLDHLPPAAALDYWQDYHAQLVRIGKEFCRPRAPRCDSCPLRPLLPPASSLRGGA
jgi:endonuclease-3 related protein